MDGREAEEEAGYDRDGGNFGESEESEGEDVSQVLGGERGKPREEMSTFEKRQQKVRININVKVFLL